MAKITRKELTLTLVDQLKKHALDHYEDANGHRWDYIVECWTDDELSEEIINNQLATWDMVREHFAEYARLMYEQELNARASYY